MARKPVYRSRTMVADFELDRQGIRQIALKKQFDDACADVIRSRARPYAVSISPVSNRNDKGHVHYVTSFRTEHVVVTIRGLRRRGVRLHNKAPHAAAVEFGNKATQGHHVLAHTLQHISGRPLKAVKLVLGRRLTRRKRPTT